MAASRFLAKNKAEERAPVAAGWRCGGRACRWCGVRAVRGGRARGPAAGGVVAACRLLSERGAGSARETKQATIRTTASYFGAL